MDIEQQLNDIEQAMASARLRIVEEFQERFPDMRVIDKVGSNLIVLVDMGDGSLNHLGEAELRIAAEEIAVNFPRFAVSDNRGFDGLDGFGISKSHAEYAFNRIGRRMDYDLDICLRSLCYDETADKNRKGFYRDFEGKRRDGSYKRGRRGRK